MAKYDPNYLLSRVVAMYDTGRLERSAREELTRWTIFLCDNAEVDKQLLLEALKRLASDLYLPVRDRLGQFLPRINHEFRMALYDALAGASDEWQNACAVYSLGFWSGDESKLTTAGFARSPIVRYMADQALEMSKNRVALEQIAENYSAPDGITRLVAYLSLKEQGDEYILWKLRQFIPEREVARAFFHELQDDIRKRLASERKKRSEEEDKSLSAYKPV